MCIPPGNQLPPDLHCERKATQSESGESQAKAIQIFVKVNKLKVKRFPDGIMKLILSTYFVHFF